MAEPACRPARAKDLDLLLPLFLEMERFYEGDAAIGAEAASARLDAALAGYPPGLLLVAEDGAALGFCSVYAMFPGRELGAMWYLKELFVSAAARGRGVGEALIRAAAREVIARGGQRLEFTTDGMNAAAQRFYARMDAPVVPKVFYRYEDAALAALAGLPAAGR
jgi:ribosomal protein S18 acetylase RimI-like enzyme